MNSTMLGTIGCILIGIGLILNVTADLMRNSRLHELENKVQILERQLKGKCDG